MGTQEVNNLLSPFIEFSGFCMWMYEIIKEGWFDIKSASSRLEEERVGRVGSGGRRMRKVECRKRRQLIV